MKTILKILIILVVLALCGIALYMGFFMGSGKNGSENTTSPNLPNTSFIPEKDLPHIIRTTGFFPVNATVYQSINPLMVYEGALEKNGSIDLQLHQIFEERQNVTTVQEAQGVSEKILEAYGGVPRDAEYGGADTSYTETYNHTLHQTTKREAVITTVFYSQEINGLPVFGDSNVITLTLGSNGELLWIFKVWRNYTPDGEVQLISVDEAINKLERQDWYETTWSPVEGNVTIDSIGQGYYALDINESSTKLEPVWVMSGRGATGNRIDFHIYARQFANFTASPTIASPSEEIQFSDRSGASPTRGFWDFGDGTNSTLRNPAHVYQKPGTYNVTLTVWNEMGDDSLVKSGYITVLPSGNPSPQT